MRNNFGAPQVMIAAAHQDVADQLAGVIGFGGYCDVASMIRFQMTGRFDWEDATHRLRPDPYGRWIMGGNHLTSIPEYQNAQDVADALRRRTQRSQQEAPDPCKADKKRIPRRVRNSQEMSRRDVFAGVPPSRGGRQGQDV